MPFDPTTLTLATSRYANTQAISQSGLAPVGITAGEPRFRLGYELAANVKLLAPLRAWFSRPDFDHDVFTHNYFARLDSFGFERISRVLGGLADAAPGCVLLCFEDVWRGEFCHRRLFAEWWEEKTGVVVPELPSAGATPPMF